MPPMITNMNMLQTMLDTLHKFGDNGPDPNIDLIIVRVDDTDINQLDKDTILECEWFTDRYYKVAVQNGPSTAFKSVVTQTPC